MPNIFWDYPKFPTHISENHPYTYITMNFLEESRGVALEDDPEASGSFSGVVKFLKSIGSKIKIPKMALQNGVLFVPGEGT